MNRLNLKEKFKDIKYLKTLCIQIRRDILRMVHGVQSGHPGGSLGAVEFFVALYEKILNHNAKNFKMEGENEDLFFLSNGHISPVFYSILARKEYFPLSELNTFRKINSRLQGHPSSHDGLPGVRISSGSLGQGMSVAIGAAQGKKLKKDPGLIYSSHGDGELNEGQIWEAALYAGGKKIDNYIAVIDYNGQQIDGSTNEVMPLGNIGSKFKAFDWEVLNEAQGNNLEKVIEILRKAKSFIGKGKPILIILHTKMGSGIDFMEGTNLWHGKAPNDKELDRALVQIPETCFGDYPT